jgi:holo-[acyl-carrier protein] synthase
MSWRSCEILNEPGGKPVLRLSGELAQWFEARDLVAHVSVTDETDYAAAMVVVEARAAAAQRPLRSAQREGS